MQLSPRIDPHDLGIKVMHAIDFLCEDMKVKVALKFRGREMAHTEVGFEVIKKFIAEIAPYGHPDFQPKLVGRGINLMISPLPRNKRAKNPHAVEDEACRREHGHAPEKSKPRQTVRAARAEKAKVPVADEAADPAVCNNPFAKLGNQIAARRRALTSRAPIRETGSPSQTAFECSQKSRTICIKPCCAAARFQNARVGSSQQTLPRQFQNRIVLRRRPREKPPLHFALNFFIAAFLRANPQPRQNHVHRQIRHARRAEQRLRFCHPRRFERPVPRPEFIAFDLENFVERIRQQG